MMCSRGEGGPTPQRTASIIAAPTASEQVHVPIICNGNRGRFLLEHQSCVCHCKGCEARAARHNVAYHEMTPTEFERHSGAHQGLADIGVCVSAHSNDGRSGRTPNVCPGRTAVTYWSWDWHCRDGRLQEVEVHPPSG
jgi:hypothetical protein